MNVLQVNSLFLLELALGCLLLLPLFSSKDISKGFFALHGGIAAIALGLARLLDRGAGNLPGDRVVWALLALALGGTILSGAGLRRSGLALFWPASLISAAVIVTGTPAFHGALASTWLLLGALVLASTTMTMNLGHWYLVTKDLPTRHLVIWSAVYVGSSFGRAILFFAVAGAAYSGSYGAALREQLLSPFGDGFFLATRFLWGILGTTVLSLFVLKTARMRSNQAATGLLYVALVFALVGELLAAYLTIRTGIPL